MSNEEEFLLIDGGFNNIRENLLNHSSRLYLDPPDILIVIPDSSLLSDPDFISRPMQFDQSTMMSIIESATARFSMLVQSALEKLEKTQILVCLPPVPCDSPLGLLDGNLPDQAFAEHLERANVSVANQVRDNANIHVCNLDNFFRRHGWEKLVDRRLHYLTKSPYSREGLRLLADYLLMVSRTIACPSKKVIVCDLDNTLWGGILGEDGSENIRISSDGVGRAYYDFQLALKEMADRGLLLAIASKNNESEALAALESLPFQVLRPHDFTAIRIGWQDKATSIREIAEELNLGLDSFVFLDDSNLEREWVRRALPEVEVIDLPLDESQYRQCLLDVASLWAVGVTKEDLSRAKTYTSNKKRRQLEESFASYDDYLASLEMKVFIEPVSEQSLERFTQLINKTNQFNLTMKRYDIAETKNMLAQPESWKLLTLSLNDIFDEYGIIGAGILKKEGEVAWIDVLLMSCRVIGRKVETAFLASIVDYAAAWNAMWVRGKYVSDRRNHLAVGFFRDHRFEEIGTDDDGSSHWQRSVQPLQTPSQIEILAPVASPRSLSKERDIQSRPL